MGRTSTGWRRSQTSNTENEAIQEAEIEIDPMQLDGYRAAVQEQTEAAIRKEPGVPVLIPKAINFVDVGYWHETEMPPQSLHVRYREQSGRHLLAASISPFGPGADIGRTEIRPLGPY
jgi:hypothetical protein